MQECWSDEQGLELVLTGVYIAVKTKSRRRLNITETQKHEAEEQINKLKNTHKLGWDRI